MLVEGALYLLVLVEEKDVALEAIVVVEEALGLQGRAVEQLTTLEFIT